MENLKKKNGLTGTMDVKVDFMSAMAYLAYYT